MSSFLYSHVSSISKFSSCELHFTSSFSAPIGSDLRRSCETHFQRIPFRKSLPLFFSFPSNCKKTAFRDLHLQNVHRRVQFTYLRLTVIERKAGAARRRFAHYSDLFFFRKFFQQLSFFEAHFLFWSLQMICQWGFLLTLLWITEVKTKVYGY